MNAISYEEFNTHNHVEKFALKNYKTYVSHYKERKLTPMSFQEFLKNYIS